VIWCRVKCTVMRRCAYELHSHVPSRAAFISSLKWLIACVCTVATQNFTQKRVEKRVEKLKNATGTVTETVTGTVAGGLSTLKGKSGRLRVDSSASPERRVSAVELEQVDAL
jgi:hypothetical protein